jgi:transposase
MEEIEANISRYLAELDTADRHEPTTAQARSVRINDKIAAMKSQMATLKEIEAKLDATGEAQISLTDPDARSMITRGSGIVGYNVQTAVDAKHHLIIEHEVTNIGNDRDQLSGMAKKARTAIGKNSLTVIADRGYFKGEEILACSEAGIAALVPATKTSNAKADGRFDKADFVYDREKNEYLCPAGQSLIWRFSYVEKGMTNHRYWSSNCKGCALKDKCTPNQQRRVTRWEHQDVLEAMQARAPRVLWMRFSRPRKCPNLWIELLCAWRPSTASPPRPTRSRRAHHFTRPLATPKLVTRATSVVH